MQRAALFHTKTKNVKSFFYALDRPWNSNESVQVANIVFSVQ